MIEMSSDYQNGTPPGIIQTMCFLPTAFMLHNLKPMTGLAKEYADRDVRFYQLFGLTVNLGLYHALCAIRRTAPGEWNRETIKSWTVLAPTMKDGLTRKVKSSLRVVEDQFIVPDGLEDNGVGFELFDTSLNAPHQSKYPAENPSQATEVMSSFVDARTLFEVAFLRGAYQRTDSSSSPNEPENMADYMHGIYLAIDERRKLGQQGLMTL
jgi:hypothetical protein